MKKLLTILSTAAVLAIPGIADISQAQIDTYLEVSGGNAVLSTIQTQIGDSIEQQLLSSGKPVNKEIVALIAEIFAKDEHLAKFTMDLQKLDESDYAQIIAFYQTPLGKEVARISQQMDMVNLQEEMRAYMIEINQNPLSDERRKLLKDLYIILDMENYSVNIYRAMFTSMNNELPEEVRMTQEQMDSTIEQLRTMIAQQSEISAGFSYRNLSDEQIAALIAYYQSDAAKEEVKAMMNGTLHYIDSVSGDMIRTIMDKAKEGTLPAPEKE